MYKSWLLKRIRKLCIESWGMIHIYLLPLRFLINASGISPSSFDRVFVLSIRLFSTTGSCTSISITWIVWFDGAFWEPRLQLPIVLAVTGHSLEVLVCFQVSEGIFCKQEFIVPRNLLLDSSFGLFVDFVRHCCLPRINGYPFPIHCIAHELAAAIWNIIVFIVCIEYREIRLFVWISHSCLACSAVAVLEVATCTLVSEDWVPSSKVKLTVSIFINWELSGNALGKDSVNVLKISFNLIPCTGESGLVKVIHVFHLWTCTKTHFTLCHSQGC